MVGLFATETLMGTSTVWVQQAANTIGNTVCTMIDTRLSDGLVAVATHGKGMFTANITSKSDIVSINDISKQSESFFLNAFPNPAKQEAKINFRLKTKTKITLRVYDISGKEIKTLENAELPEGEYNYSFERDGLPSGIYYYSLSSPDKRKTGKLIFVE